MGAPERGSSDDTPRAAIPSRASRQDPTQAGAAASARTEPGTPGGPSLQATPDAAAPIPGKNHKIVLNADLEPLVEGAIVHPDGTRELSAPVGQPICVNVRVTFEGEADPDVGIKPRIVSGQGSVFHSTGYEETTDAEGVAGFGFLCPRRPGTTDVAVEVPLADEPRKQLKFRFVARPASLALSPAWDSYWNAPAVLAVTHPPLRLANVILEETDASGAVLEHAVLKKADELGLVWTCGEDGTRLMFVRPKQGASGKIHLLATVQMIEDKDGNPVQSRIALDLGDADGRPR
jgi:hypothetical protein